MTLRNRQTCVGPAGPSGRPTGEVIVVVVGVGETVEHYVHLGAHVLQAAGFSRMELARHCLMGMNEKRREIVIRYVVVILVGKQSEKIYLFGMKTEKVLSRELLFLLVNEESFSH